MKAGLSGPLSCADKALTLAQDMSKSVSYSKDNDFGFVALRFLHKQVEYARSINVLVHRGLGRDAQPVARAVQETVASLYCEPSRLFRRLGR